MHGADMVIGWRWTILDLIPDPPMRVTGIRSDRTENCGGSSLLGTGTKFG
jgi:hypothetical protein